MAIGAQNAFVLRQGIRREFVLPVVLICALSDALLEFLGIAGIGYVIERAPAVIEVVRWGGVTFLIGYAFVSARRALRPGQIRDLEGGSGSLKKTIATCFAITWLNPSVYLDTLVLLGYGARVLRPLFQPPRSWQILDGVIAIVMLAIAARLAFGSLA